MGNTQGESRSSKIYGAITAVALVAVFGGIGVAAVQANAAAQAHTTLMAEVKADGRTLNAASTEDAAVVVAAVQASQVAHVNAIAAQETATRVAAEQAAAAAAEAARVAAEQAAQAAAQLAQQQAAAQGSADDSSSDPAPGGPIKCPAGSQANSGDGPNDTSCLPEICFHITLPDPAHPDCETPFKP